MSSQSLRHRILTAAVAFSVAATSVGCGAGTRGQTEEQLAVGEAAAAVTHSEEETTVGDDTVALGAETEVEASATESSELPQPVPQGVGDVCDFGERKKRVMAEYDANQNGKLDPEELDALKADLKAEHPRFARVGWRFRRAGFHMVRWAFDENGDRQLSDEERAAMVDALEARCERIRANVLEKFDADGDGKLSEAEREAAREAFRAKMQAKYQELLAKYDANNSGQLELIERAKIRADVIAALKAKRAELIAKYDTDGDGKLSTEEALPLRQAIQDRIINGKEGA